MNDIIKLPMALFITTLTAALSLSYIASKTDSLIKEQETAREREALLQIMPSNDSLVKGDRDGVTYWKAYSGESVTAVAMRVTTDYAYSSYISMLVSFNSEGMIRGLSILSQEETPGLGARVTEIPSSKTFWGALFKRGSEEQGFPWFTDQFSELYSTKPIEIVAGTEYPNLSIDDQYQLKDENQVTAITGATVTTEAVTKALYGAFDMVSDLFQNEKQGDN